MGLRIFMFTMSDTIFKNILNMCIIHDDWQFMLVIKVLTSLKRISKQTCNSAWQFHKEEACVCCINNDLNAVFPLSHVLPWYLFIYRSFVITKLLGVIAIWYLNLYLIEGNPGIWKQDPEANIWAQEGWEWGVERALQWGTSYIVPFT